MQMMADRHHYYLNPIKWYCVYRTYVFNNHIANVAFMKHATFADIANNNYSSDRDNDDNMNVN